MVEQFAQEGWTQLGGSCSEATTKPLPHPSPFLSIVFGNSDYLHLAFGQLKCSGAHLASSGGALVSPRWCLIVYATGSLASYVFIQISCRCWLLSFSLRFRGLKGIWCEARFMFVRVLHITKECKIFVSIFPYTFSLNIMPSYGQRNCSCFNGRILCGALHGPPKKRRVDAYIASAIYTIDVSTLQLSSCVS